MIRYLVVLAYAYGVGAFMPQASRAKMAMMPWSTRLHVASEHPNAGSSNSFGQYVNGYVPSPSNRDRYAVDDIIDGRIESFITDVDDFNGVKDEYDVAQMLEADVCLLDPISGEQHEDRQWSLWLDNVLHFVPAVLPVLAFLFYEPVAQLFSFVLETMSTKNWVAVDGNMYGSMIIAPAINGVVVPSIAILFANLLGNTITVLRARQSEIHNIINQEAGQLRLLKIMLDSFPSGDVRDRCQYYLYQYTNRIISEAHETIDQNDLDLSGMDSELNGILTELNGLALDDVAETDLPSHVLGQSYSACRKLLEERSRRITYLQSTFPSLHYATLATLAMSICVCFLMETDQELLVFLNAVQLKILWSALIGTFSALAVVCYDLLHPFRGNYQISRSVDQLHTIRMVLKAEIEDYRCQ